MQVDEFLESNPDFEYDGNGHYMLGNHSISKSKLQDIIVEVTNFFRNNKCVMMAVCDGYSLLVSLNNYLAVWYAELHNLEDLTATFISRCDLYTMDEVPVYNKKVDLFTSIVNKVIKDFYIEPFDKDKFIYEFYSNVLLNGLTYKHYSNSISIIESRIMLHKYNYLLKLCPQ